MQNSFFINRKGVYAAETPDTTNIVAVFVDKNIYSNIEANLERYTSTYIQGKISNGKVVVLPIDTVIFQAHEVSQILENMYFEGLKDQSSKLVGTILIWDIPLPVVENNGFIYPSIYPYVDFEKQQFIYDTNKKFFVYNDNPNGQAELRHAIIKFDETSAYNDFFLKVKNYKENPTEFIDKAIRYDDFIGTKKYFIPENTKYYVNSMIFGEDIGYHRYTPLLLNTLLDEHNGSTLDIGDWLQNDLDGVEDQDLLDYAAMIKEKNDEAKITIAGMDTTLPTLTLKKSTDEMLKSYDGLIGSTFLSKTQDNVAGLARRYRTGTSFDEINGHTDKINQTDNWILGDNDNNVQPFLIQINDFLESGLNTKIEDEKRYLTIPIPTSSLEFEGKEIWIAQKKCVRKTYNYYENYFFGKNANLITSAQDTTIYKWTYQNLNTLSWQTTTNLTQNIWASYRIFSTQVEANRWYNIGNAQDELERYDNYKTNKQSLRYVKCRGIRLLGSCIGKSVRVADDSADEDKCDVNDTDNQWWCESMTGFAARYRWGGSPLNLDTTTMQLQNYNYKNAIFPIYDIAGSKKVATQQVATGSYQSAIDYTTMIQRKFSIGVGDLQYGNNDIISIIKNTSNNATNLIFTNQLPSGNLRHPTRTYTQPKTYQETNFFAMYDILPYHITYAQRAIVAKITSGDCWGIGDIYSYKTIDSRVKNTAPERDQISNSERYKFKEDSDLDVFYTAVMKQLSETKNTIREVTQEFSGVNSTDLTWVISNLAQIKQIITSGNNGMQTIISYPYSGLLNMNSTQIAALATQRNTNNLNTDKINLINQKITKAKYWLESLLNYTKALSIDNIKYLISDIIQTEGFKWQKVEILQTRRESIFQNFGYISGNMADMKTTVITAQSLYNTIGDLQNNIYLLQAKRLSIAALHLWSWCSAWYYKPVCDVIDNLVSVMQWGQFATVNTNIDHIAQYTGDNDEYGNPTIVQPFPEIIQELTTGAIFEEIQQIAGGIYTFDISTDADKKEINKGMNLTTADRPIDNIRNITFKGIWWDLVQFNYPNLYEVAVYKQAGEKLQLKTPQEIKTAIKTYLIGKVTEYNTLLNTQRNKKADYYNTASNQFTFLGQLDPLANPNNAIHNYGENSLEENYFVDQIIDYLDTLQANPQYGKQAIYGDMDANTDDQKLDMIANFLYQQNITRPEKLVQTDVTENINEAKNSFDINQKINSVVNNYLTENNDQGTFVTPTYKSKGYEVAYINTDGQDYVSAKSAPSFIKQIQTLQANAPTPTSANKFLEQVTTDLQQEVDDCEWVDTNGSALIFELKTLSSPRAKAMKCRAEKVRAKPFSIEVGFKNALGPVVGGNLKEIGNSFQNFWNDRKEYGAQRTTANNDDTINQAEGNIKDILRWYNTNAVITTSETIVGVSEIGVNDTKPIQVKVAMAKDMGNINIKISATGDNCFMIGTKNICNQEEKAYENPNIEEQIFDLTLSSKKAGSTAIKIQLCPGTNDQCIVKQHVIQILPWPVDTITLETIQPASVIEWWALPIKVTAVDQRSNPIGQTTESYTISVASWAGTINGTNRVEFNNFSDAEFIYQAPSWLSKNEVATIDVTPSEATKNILAIQPTTQKTAQTSVRITKGIVTIKQGTSILYRTDTVIPDGKYLQLNLPKNESDIQFIDSGGIAQIHPEAIPSIEISVQDPNGNTIDTIANIANSKGLLLPGATQNNNGKFSFHRANDFIINGTKEIAFYPSFKAGEETITINIPGQNPIVIPIKVNPGPAKTVLLQLEKSRMDLTTTKNSKWTINIVDTRNNKITTWTVIKLWVIGWATTNTSEFIYSGNEYIYTVTATGAGGEWYIFAYIKDRALTDQVPGYQRFIVQESVLPTKDLNVMYLNLFWADRGNQRWYFSENNKVVNNITSQSDKVLATTTQLIDPNKIKQIEYIITPHGQIQSISNKQSTLTIQNKTFVVAMPDIANIHLGATNEFEIKKLNDSWAINTFEKNKHTLLYIPEPTDSVITGNEATKTKITINGLDVIDLNKWTIDPNIQILANNETLNDMSTYTMTFQGKNIGKILIWNNNDITLDAANIDLQDSLTYGTTKIFSQWSTNIPAVGIYVVASAFTKQGYISIEDSADPMLWIWFTSKFKNISNFANGKLVGEATLAYGSQFLINFGDPLLERRDKNPEIPDTDFDGAIGQTIYNDPNKTIFKSLPIDFNDDKLKDILVVYTDGSIKLLKNYGGKEWYKDMQELMIIAESIKDVQVGDADGDGNEDIFIITNTGKGLVYLNNDGIFSVDGKNICLNTNTEPNTQNPDPENLSTIKQFFIEDMDDDGKMDIVTNDTFNDAKIFYGGKTNNGANYISNITGACDDQRYERQKNNYKIIKRFGIKIDSETVVQDESLVHWRWAVAPTEGIEEEINDTTEDTTVYTKEKLKEMKDTATQDAKDFVKDLNNNIAVGAAQLAYVENPLDISPAYEQVIAPENIYYLPINQNWWVLSGIASIYKNYNDMNGGILRDKDVVVIQTTILSKKNNNKLTYMDVLNWPREVAKDTDGKISSLVFTNGNTWSLTIDWTIADGYQFVMDNITLNSGERLTFSYIVTYKQQPITSIDVQDMDLLEKNKSKDEIPDISFASTDPCQKGRRILFNEKTGTKRSYTGIFQDLQTTIDEYNSAASSTTESTIDDLLAQLDDIQGVDDISNIEWANQSLESRVNINLLTPAEILANLNITSNLIDSSTAKVSEKLDEALKWLCQWFELGKGGCQGVPVPFNQAFLAPGNYHLFWCVPKLPNPLYIPFKTLNETLGKWLPVLSFPTAMIPFVRPPLPAGAWGLFGNIPSPTSQFRLYIVPTLTLGLGIAMCGWPYPLGSKIPKPFSDLWGNCIVFAFWPITNCDATATVGPITSKIDANIETASHVGTCNNPPTVTNTIVFTENNQFAKQDSTSTPFRIVAANSQENNAQYSAAIPSWNFWWLISIDQVPITTTSAEGNTNLYEWYTLEAEEKIDLKILGAKTKGLVKCVVQDWTTRQIQYIQNNLTKMTIQVDLPDLTTFVQGFDKIGNLEKTYQELNANDKAAGYIASTSGSMLDINWDKTWWTLGRTQYVSKQELNNLSQTIGDNPFEAIQDIFKEVPLVNIDTQDINIKIPALTTDDIKKYQNYLKLRSEKNGKIVEDRGDSIASMASMCSVQEIADQLKDSKTLVKNISNLESLKTEGKISAEQTQQLEKFKELKKKVDVCLQFDLQLPKFISFRENTAGLISSVKANINILEKYKAFPTQLYQRTHINDRYLTEISALLSDFTNSTTTRLDTNANRFSQYVDAITLLVGTIKTRQAIIDFSVNRSEKCSKCSNDNYGSFSCSLSFLCPKLPIFPIPAFKIPNIYMDMSHIELGMNIILPKINFIPTKISLPQLPNLPEPPTIEVDRDIMYGLDINFFEWMSLPSIPIIPEPPTLPEPPSFIPSFKMDLPVLPPAPKIPKILPEINGVLKVADFIGKIFCIVKWGVGLVGEKSVKGKVEQITQRTRNVPVFDYFDLTTKFKDPPLEGFDYKMDAYTTLKFNFDGVYDVFNNIASITNNMVSQNIEAPIQKAVDWTTDKANNNGITDTGFDIIDGLNQNLNFNGYIPQEEDEGEMMDYASAYSELRAGLINFQNSTTTDKVMNDKVKTILATVENKSSILPATKQIQQVQDAAQSIISDKQKENETLQKQISDYDKFIESIKDETIVLVDDKTTSASLTTPLFTIDNTTKTILASQENPTKTYLTLNQTMIDGYLKAVNGDGAEKLNMSQSTYNKSKKYLETTKEKIDTALLAYEERPMLAQATEPCTDCGDNEETSTDYSSDISAYAQWVFVESYSGDQKSVINTVISTQQSESVKKTYTTNIDLNNDGKEDIFMYDSNTLYIKYADQENENFSAGGNEIGRHSTKFYSYAQDHPLLQKRYIWSYEELRNIADENGYLEINDITIKLVDQNKEPKNFKTDGQSFDNLQLSWKNSKNMGELVDWYLIKVSNKIDEKDTPNSFRDFLHRGDKAKYIIALPQGTDYEKWMIMIDDTIKSRITSQLGSSILAVEYFSPSQDKISVTLKELPRKWLYTSLATLTIDQTQLSSSQQKVLTLYRKTSPRSNQTVAGLQNLGDVTAPVGETMLRRDFTNQTISTGFTHEGFINTHYTLKSIRTDDVVVKKIIVQGDGISIPEKDNDSSQGTLDITGLFFTWATQQQYEFIAIDQNNNIAKQQVTINIKVPEIEIVDLKKSQGAAEIIAKISNDLDEWTVIFQRLRNSIRKNIAWSDQNIYGWFDLTGGQTIITGGIFTIGNDIGLYDNQGNELATINPETGEITIKEWYQDRVKLHLNLTTHIPVVELRDTINNITLFQITLPVQSITKIQMNQSKPSYELIKLTEGQFGDFDNGYCLKNSKNDCILYTNNAGAIYIPGIYASSLAGEYLFDTTTKTTTYIIKDQSNKAITTLLLQLK